MLKTIFSILAFALIAGGAGAVSAESFLGKHGDWEAFSDAEAGKTVCYMGSEPTDKRGKYKVRGATYLMVTHRPAENSKNVVSVRAGYTHKAGVRRGGRHRQDPVQAVHQGRLGLRARRRRRQRPGDGDDQAARK